jgi:hypothetical protein
MLKGHRDHGRCACSYPAPGGGHEVWFSADIGADQECRHGINQGLGTQGGFFHFIPPEIMVDAAVHKNRALSISL